MGFLPLRPPAPPPRAQAWWGVCPEHWKHRRRADFKVSSPNLRGISWLTVSNSFKLLQGQILRCPSLSGSQDSHISLSWRSGLSPSSALPSAPPPTHTSAVLFIPGSIFALGWRVSYGKYCGQAFPLSCRVICQVPAHKRCPWHRPVPQRHETLPGHQPRLLTVVMALLQGETNPLFFPTPSMLPFICLGLL